MVEDRTSESSTRDSYEFVLEGQSDSYTHVQNQAQRILRVLLASIAVVVAFTRTSLYQSLYQLLSNLKIPEQQIKVAGGAVTHSSSFYRQFGELNLIIGVLLTIISAFLVADSAIQSFRVLREHPVQPTQEQGSTAFALAMRMETIPKSMYQQWARENSEKLERMNRRLQGAYARVLEAGLVFVVSVTILGGVYSGQGHLVALIDWILVAIGISSLALLAYNLGTAATESDSHWSEGIRREVNYWFEGEFRSTPSAIAAYLILMVYAFVFMFALLSGLIWLKAVWYLEITAI